MSYDLIDATDWLPTFYHLAGGDVKAIQDKIDGVNVWDTIARGTASPRTEVNVYPNNMHEVATTNTDKNLYAINL